MKLGLVYKTVLPLIFPPIFCLVTKTISILLEHRAGSTSIPSLNKKTRNKSRGTKRAKKFHRATYVFIFVFLLQKSYYGREIHKHRTSNVRVNWLNHY